mmetsp:Transcript_17836/g.31445  ORF Transcript_17836/g.31445 Transcript_17836/m.31445 type:complete len:84 (-) Transcript_17836:23-274(-)
MSCLLLLNHGKEGWLQYPTSLFLQQAVTYLFFLHSVVDFFSNIIIDTIMVVDEFFSTLPSSHQNKYLTITSHRGSHLLRGPGG